MIVNQCIDLVQEQVDTLWQLAQLGCEWRLAGLCVTSVQYQNFTHAANLSKRLSQFLLQNWSSSEFEDTMRELMIAIVHVNSTRIDLSIASSLTSWLNSAMDHLKEWVGLGAFAGLMVLASLVCLWCLCQIRKTQKRDAVMITQAFMAIEAGQSPHAWLSLLQR
ncbi:Envelope glycoprotein [Cricetulus griseus]|nr:Envelope glycoprotein [Cricetulus griseus]